MHSQAQALIANCVERFLVLCRYPSEAGSSSGIRDVPTSALLKELLRRAKLQEESWQFPRQDQKGVRVVDEFASVLLRIPSKIARNTWDSAKRCGFNTSKHERGRRSNQSGDGMAPDQQRRVAPGDVARADDLTVSSTLVRAALSNAALGRPYAHFAHDVQLLSQAKADVGHKYANASWPPAVEYRPIRLSRHSYIWEYVVGAREALDASIQRRDVMAIIWLHAGSLAMRNVMWELSRRPPGSLGIPSDL